MTENKSTVEVACYHCDFANRTLGIAIGEERYVLPYGGAKFVSHQLSCGHLALVFAEGKFSNPVTYEVCKPGEIISFHRSSAELAGPNFILKAGVEPRVFHPIFGDPYGYIRIADGICSSHLRIYPKEYFEGK